jgi:pyrroline-5-carboxylate reductase
MMKIGIIGLGKMGEAIATGLKLSPQSKLYSVSATVRRKDRAKEAGARLKIACHTDNEALVEASDVVVLCVKPHQVDSVLAPLKGHFQDGQLLISVVASVTLDQLVSAAGVVPAVIRAMPNTPCLIRQGMSVLCASPQVKSAQVAVAEQLFQALGSTAVIEESLMDAATGLSGCGPAYVYLMIEALSEAGVKLGLSREVSTRLAAQTLSGASQMVLARGVHPAALKDEVTTPAGCTVDGLMALEEGKLRVTLIKAVLAASTRSQALRQRGQG